MRHIGRGRRLLRHLQGTKGPCSFFTFENRGPMESFPDADWAGGRNSRPSTTGILVEVNETSVLWTTKKHTLIALSFG